MQADDIADQGRDSPAGGSSDAAPSLNHISGYQTAYPGHPPSPPSPHSGQLGVPPLHADVLLVTVTDIETHAVFGVLQRQTGHAPTPHYRNDKTYYYLGKIGHAEVWLVRSEMGAVVPGGSFATIYTAIGTLRPTTIVMVGVAFGTRPHEQRIGDVLVARQLVSYEPQRITGSPHAPGTATLLGDRVSSSVRLLDRCRDGGLAWPGARVLFGLILSGDKLIEHHEAIAQVLSQAPDAIGGEMEGAGLYVAAAQHKLDWILIKGIAGWIDGHQSKDMPQHQIRAAEQAAAFALHVLARGGFAPAQERSQAAQAHRHTILTAKGEVTINGYNVLRPLDLVRADAPIQIGTTHLIGYSGPDKIPDRAARYALEQAYRSEIATRYGVWRTRYASLSLQTTLNTSRPKGTAVEREDQVFAINLKRQAEQRRNGEPEDMTLTFTDLRAGLQRCGDLLLLGSPGAGKTTALWRLALDMAEDGLYNNEEAPLPVFVRLGGIQERQDLLPTIQSDLSAGILMAGNGQYVALLAHRTLAALLPDLLREGRLVLLWDGLNETPQRSFAAISQQLESFRKHYAGPAGGTPNQHVITCRADDYERLVKENPKAELRLHRTIIQRLDKATVRQIVLSRLGQERGRQLLEVLETPSQRTLAGLAHTPLLLTMLCTVYDQHGSLPSSRGRLLEQFVLTRFDWEMQQKSESKADPPLQIAALARLAYEMTESQGHGTSVAWSWARPHIAAAAPAVPPEQLRDHACAADLLERIGSGNDTVRFTHHLIQEYFAAVALREKLLQAARWLGKPVVGWYAQLSLERFASVGKRTGWEETLLLLAGLDGDQSIAHQLVRTFLSQPLEAARLLLAGGDQPDSALLDEVRTALLAQLRGSEQPLSERIKLGKALGQVGDPRLLDVGFGNAPFSEYWCSADSACELNTDTSLLQPITHPLHFKIGRFLVTNAEYQGFIDAGGYDPAQPWWTLEAKQALFSEASLPHGVRTESPLEPYWWHQDRYNNPAQPVVGISWYEAVAYASWLTLQGHLRGWLPPGDLIRLPTYREWQYATGAPCRHCYPWGADVPTPAHANYVETKLGSPSPVGCFPAGQSAWGVLDMAGNVWEWVATRLEALEQAKAVTEGPPTAQLVLLGGAFHSSSEQLRCHTHMADNPHIRYYYRGFRLVWLPDTST